MYSSRDGYRGRQSSKVEFSRPGFFDTGPQPSPCMHVQLCGFLKCS